MIIPGQIVKMKWNNNNRDWFESLGYTGYERHKVFDVKAEDLSPSSKEKIEVQCDMCGVKYVSSFAQCYKQINKYGMTLCRQCACLYAGKYTRMRQAEKIWPKIEQMCDKWRYTLITKKEDYIDAHMKIEYICPKHGVQDEWFEKYKQKK